MCGECRLVNIRLFQEQIELHYLEEQNAFLAEHERRQGSKKTGG